MKKSTLGLAVIAAIPMFSSVQVLAADEAAKSIEKIQVTGSRIKRSDMETASPVTLIGADEIKASGATSVGNNPCKTAVFADIAKIVIIQSYDPQIKIPMINALRTFLYDLAAKIL